MSHIRCQNFHVNAIVLLLALFTVTAARSQPPDDRVTVLVGFKQKPGASEEALIKISGGTVTHKFRLIPAIAAKVPKGAIDGLKKHSLVNEVVFDTAIHSMDTELDSSWGVAQIGAGVPHAANNTGAGVKVCVIDTGIDYTHPDLADRYDAAASWDFIAGDNDPFDDNGHGTHVAGIIAANDNGFGVVGVAPSATIIALKILDQNGNGSIIDAVSALDRCYQYGGHIANHSYGSNLNPGAQIQQAYDKAYTLGLVNVASAGNGASCDVSYPARYESVIAVAATDNNNQRANSCTGPEVELAAPGVNINSTVPGGGYDNSYSGTSMASPHVAGVAALVRAAGMTNAAQIRQRLTSTAQDLGAPGLDAEYGYGLVRADLAAPATPSAGSSAPDPPTDLDAAVYGASVNLTWTDNSVDEEAFVIERCTVGKKGTCVFSEIDLVESNITVFSETGLRKSKLRYRVKARNSFGDSIYSNGVSVKLK